MSLLLPGPVPAEHGFLHAVRDGYLAATTAPHPYSIQAPRSRLARMHRWHSSLSGVQRRSRRIQDHDMAWLETGRASAEPVVLLHGFGSAKENWLPLAPLLNSRYRLFMLDLPAWGESSFNASARYGLEDQVGRVAEWIRREIGRPVHLVGNSAGGAAAGLLAGRHPELTQTLALLNPAGLHSPTQTRFQRELAQGVNPMLPANLAGVHRLLKLAMHNRGLALSLAPVMAGDIIARRDLNAHLFAELMRHMPDVDAPGLSACRAPTLVLWGDHDRLVHVSGIHTARALLPTAQSRILRGIGHLPMVEAPRLSARMLHRFWQEQAHALPRRWQRAA